MVDTKKIRLADFVINYLISKGIESLFTVTGGGAMFLNDACAANKKIKTICNHHEQACAMAAVGYSKYKNDFAAAILTTGCGATNAITGLLDAWQDNNPVVFISGQVKRKETSFNAKTKLRQFGVQEANIIEIVKSITKYSVMVNDPYEIEMILDKAFFEAKSGRPGPVWIDIPLDIQGSIIDLSKLKKSSINRKNDYFVKSKDIENLKHLLKKAQRPILIAGNGIRLGNSIELFKEFIYSNKIPYVTSYLSVDILPNDNPYFIGRLGIKGDRAGNFALQNSDLVISVGCHLSVALTGFEYNLFAREAKLVVVDIDRDEHKKNTVKIDKFIHADAHSFFNNFKTKFNFSKWCKKCLAWKSMWPVFENSYFKKNGLINKYAFIFYMQKYLKNDSVVISDAGSSYYVTSQAFSPIKKQRYVTSGAQADMGFSLPAAIGVSIAHKKEFVVAITGDGSLQMNIQELQTLVHYKLPVKLVVWNNNGYLSIRTTQKKFFNGREIGTDPSSGVSFPNTQKIAKAYGIKYFKSLSIKTLENVLNNAFNYKGPVIIEIFNPFMQEIIPTASSAKNTDGTMVSKPLEDMYPFLDRDLFYKEMIIKPVDEK